MITEIKTLNDVKAFAKHLVHVEKLSFHPDEDFNDYIKLNTNEPFYTSEEASKRNRLMNDCFEVCDKHNKEVYEIMFPIISKEFKSTYGLKK